MKEEEEESAGGTLEDHDVSRECEFEHMRKRRRKVRAERLRTTVVSPEGANLNVLR